MFYYDMKEALFLALDQLNTVIRWYANPYWEVPFVAMENYKFG